MTDKDYLRDDAATEADSPRFTTLWSKPGECGCWDCSQEFVYGFPTKFIVCGECGNKRCPKATHHDNPCSGSNKSGQPGSRFENVPGGDDRVS